jgi:hypothetical protein
MLCIGADSPNGWRGAPAWRPHLLGQHSSSSRGQGGRGEGHLTLTAVLYCTTNTSSRKSCPQPTARSSRVTLHRIAEVLVAMT